MLAEGHRKWFIQKFTPASMQCGVTPHNSRRPVRTKSVENRPGIIIFPACTRSNTAQGANMVMNGKVKEFVYQSAALLKPDYHPLVRWF